MTTVSAVRDTVQTVMTAEPRIPDAVAQHADDSSAMNRQAEVTTTVSASKRMGIGIRSFAVVAIIFCGLAVQTGVAGAATPVWTVEASPSPGQGGLASVSCVSLTFCAAVGQYDTGAVGQSDIEMWNGVSWTLTAHPQGGTVGEFDGVSCVSTTNCVAVGFQATSSRQTLIERWNGTTWTVVPSPNVGAGDVLLAVSCPNADNCLAVGDYVGTGSSLFSLVESWNGTSWSIVPSPDLAAATSQLTGVSCVSATFCVTVGSDNVGGTVYSWNGSTWTDSLDLGTAGVLGGVSCPSATFCAGAGLTTHQAPLVEMWNGTSWRQTPTPNPGANGSPLSGISCFNSTSCVAAGARYQPNETDNLLESWDGTSWVVPPSPNVGGDAFSMGVSCTDPAVCTTVGYRAGRTLIESENGDAPFISGLSPSSGPKSGGTAVTISGAGFTGATKVAFGTAPALDVTVVSDTEITAVTPSAAPGAHNVYVTTPDGTNLPTTSDKFTYLGPGISSVSPNVGPRLGGTAVTITGVGFTGATQVRFGGVTATDVTVVSDTVITARTPSEAVGVRNVSVTTPVGTSGAVAADQFRFEARPVVTSISPSSGPTRTLVTVMGSGFTGTTKVAFGTTNATPITVISDNELTVDAPAEAPGTRHVFVTTPAGTSAGVAADQFTYTP
jgi:hypothetical protein